MEEEKKQVADNLKRRLKRIEGQLRGIQRMLDEDACCMDILIQISAVRAAISKVGVMIFENHAQKCIADSLQVDDKNKKQVLADLVNVMNNFIK